MTPRKKQRLGLEVVFPFLRLSEKAKEDLAAMHRKTCRVLLAMWMERNPDASRYDTLREAAEIMDEFGLVGKQDEEVS
jgi:hypothetical protein